MPGLQALAADYDRDYDRDCDRDYDSSPLVLSVYVCGWIYPSVRVCVRQCVCVCVHLGMCVPLKKGNWVAQAQGFP